MKTIFDSSARDEIVNRIRSLQPKNSPAWGIMTVEQMVRHCAVCDEYYLGRFKVKRSIEGELYGEAAINAILKDEASGFGKNAPTLEIFKVTEAIKDLEKEKINWINFIDQYRQCDIKYFLHWFFGEMTREQLGQFVYKHHDHHLKQFGV